MERRSKSIFLHLPIVKRKNDIIKHRKILFYIPFLCFLLVVINIFTFSLKLIYILIGIIAFLQVLACIYYCIIKERFEKAGKIVLYENLIKINDDTFPISDIKEISIKYSGFRGDDSGIFILLFYNMSDGIGNYIKIKTMDKLYEFEILIDNEIKFKLLKRLLQLYKNKNIKTNFETISPNPYDVPTL